MPLYEYQCPQDGTFERMQKFSDPPLQTCPKCGGPVEKLLSAPAIQFKGTGWYITDYARKSSTGSESKKDGGGSESKAADSGAKGAGSGSGSTPSTSGTSGSSSSDKK